MPRLFSYVVDHDHGLAPNPTGGLCTLAKCKYGTKRRNIIELAEEGDWIAGTGGADRGKSAGHGKLIYAMRIDHKMPLSEYCRAYQEKRLDAEHDIDEDGRFALLSRHFYYFGRNAVDLSEIPQNYLDHEFEKKGPGHRSDFSPAFIEEFTNWLQKNFAAGVHGLSCQPLPNQHVSPCSPKIRRKKSCR